MSNESQNQNKYNPGPAMIFAATVYVGVVLAASTLFISFVLTAFPTNAYLSRLIMTIAGVLIGASALAFPVALHTWAFEKTHRMITTAFYYGELLTMAVNTVVAFMTLLSKHTGYVIPEWALLYEPFSVGAIIYTLIAWGTVFLTDPQHKRTQQARQLKDEYEKEIAKTRMEFIQSNQGAEFIASAAAEDIRALVSEHRNGRKDFPVNIQHPTTYQYQTPQPQAIPAPAMFTAPKPQPIPVPTFPRFSDQFANFEVLECSICGQAQQGLPENLATYGWTKDANGKAICPDHNPKASIPPK